MANRISFRHAEGVGHSEDDKTMSKTSGVSLAWDVDEEETEAFGYTSQKRTWEIELDPGVSLLCYKTVQVICSVGYAYQAVVTN